MKVIRTITRVLQSFSNQKLKVMIPAAAVIMIVALLLVLLNTSSPLAPFIYSLF